MIASVLVGAAAVLLFLALCVVVPAPNMTLLVLGVGVPEASPLLLGASIVVAALLWVTGTGHTRTLGCVLLTIAVGLLVLPALQLRAATRQFDAAMASAGVSPPSSRLSTMRAVPFLLRNVPSVVDVAAVREAHGVVVAAVGAATLTADVYRPSSGDGYPVLVQIYGGAWQRGRPSDDSAFVMVAVMALLGSAAGYQYCQCPVVTM